MNGYCGFSMSVNAAMAYDDGEMPLSKWTKKNIISAMEENNIPLDVIELAKKQKVAVLKKVALHYSGWHHTSKFFNETEFYALDEETLESVEVFQEALSRYVEKPKTEPAPPETWECEYLEWTGTRNFPHAKQYKSIGVIKGNWFYLPNGRKKSINANGFKKLRKIESQPDTEEHTI